LPTTARVALAKLLSALALADGKLRPSAVKHLEKVYQLLGLEASALYSELHVASAAPEPKGISGPVTAAPKSRNEGGFKLDAARIAALQRDSERVTAMLSKVFEEQEPAAPVAAPLPLDHVERDSDEKTPRLLGLDPEHSAFLRVLLTRPSWTRAELADIAADMELMLDGALERVNEAALDAYDNRIADGDDPIEIAQDLLENVTA
jgi:TerB-C domain